MNVEKKIIYAMYLPCLFKEFFELELLKKSFLI